MNWRWLIEQQMEKNGDSWDNLVKLEELEAGSIDEEFRGGWAGGDEIPFTLWTKDYVYVPIFYDCDCYSDVVYARRNPEGVS